MRIGLTGGIAAGKSAVSGMLAELGARILDADRISREAVEPGTRGLQAIAEEFGRDVINPDGTLNRAALGEKAFADTKMLERLNDILHPIIKAEMLCRARNIEDEYPQDVIIFDVPLLIECGWQDIVDEVWLVTAPLEKRLQRIALRDGLNGEQALKRIQAQMPDAEKAGYADVIIDNAGSLDELKTLVEGLYAARKHGKKEET